MWPLNSPQLNL